MPKSSFVFALIFSISTCLTAYAQQLPVPRNIRHTYENGTRSMDGQPGPNYWQNAASYKMNIDFDPFTRKLSGTVSIEYINNSPDTLSQVWFKLYPNYYQEGAPRAGGIDPADVSDGVSIDSFSIEGSPLDPSKLNINGTNMVLPGVKINPGGRIQFRITYHYTLNEGSHNRTGQVEPNAHFIAYFFPRIAVYDDIDGWNRYPYNGRFEFYNDFSDFDVNITVPSHFIIWATGDLQNCEEVLQPGYCRLIRQAESGDSIINIIGPGDDKHNITRSDIFNSWHFKAENVTDFAFATSDHYIWQSSSVVVDSSTMRRTRVDAVFNPSHKDYFWVAPDARKTVEFMSHRFPKWPFPYAHMTVFDGLDQMEYPMMANDNPVHTRFDEVTLTTHEIFHMMFPFYVGINETKYAWMDEGWATIGEWILSPWIDTSIVDDYGVLPTEFHMDTETDLPIMTISAETDKAYFTNSYPEPAMGYLYVKDLLGETLFTKSLHYYIEQWKGKHPMPLDFFNCINTASGKNLNWFWKKWFFESGFADLAIDKVKRKGKKYHITIVSKGDKPVPIDLEILYHDGTNEMIHHNISVWEKGNGSIVIKHRSPKKIKTIQLGSTWVPDINKEDNFFELE